MNRRYLPLITFLAAVLAGTALCQTPPQPPQPPGARAPLLFVRFGGLPGLRVTFYQAGQTSRAFDAPFTAGLRPGYLYRVQLTGFPERSGLALYPTLEVRGTVSLSPGLNGANFPVPLLFTMEDIDRALAGAFITKVVFLEQPEQASPLATQPDRPLEIEARPGQDPVAEARARGRLVLIVRFGEREVDPPELVRQSIPGTVLFPGEKMLAPAQRPPYLPWACWPVYDLVLGPRPPEEECLRDGGDVGTRAGIGPDGRLYGLDPTDTVAEYADSKGRRHVAISNRVCIFAPRFAVVRTVITPSSCDLVTGPGSVNKVTGQSLVQSRQPSRETRQAEQLLAMQGRQKISGTEGSQGTVRVDQFQGMAVAMGRMKGLDIVGICRPEREQPPDRPLVLCKWADKPAAQVGEVITFHLKYSNHGGHAITDIAVSDSLGSRLEFIPSSARSDRDNVFTTQVNEAGSVILRWEIGGSLLPGQSGLIDFQARVR